MSKADAANTTIPSEIPEITPVEYQGQRVMTTEQLANAYGARPIHLQQNHANNADKFEEGHHFFKLTGSELRDFKSKLDCVELAHPFARHLILWTERGCLRHAKLLETPKAWEVFGQLEESYFVVKAAALSGSPMQRALANHGAALPAVSAEQIDRMFGIMKQMNHRAAVEAQEMAAIKSQVQALTEVVKPSVPGIFRPGKTPGAILKSEGFENCPPGVATWFGNRLEAAGALISGKLDTGTAKSRLFDADLAHEWLSKGGRAAVTRRISEKKGQGALSIPGLNIRRTKKPNPDGRGVIAIGNEVVTWQAGMTVCPGEEALLVMSQDGLHFGIGTRTMTGYDVTKTVRFGPPQGAMGMLPIFIVVGRVIDRQPAH
ncbi:ORF6N domain-containing protein [Castellaniella sp.]|uniref:ORF6N domain-containing protein n=1 Tax=Castellaniella sp. TaxID=1955812 RepID=UPI002AFF031F|nr:ORF6N domain-containing protein [Castellaniella sp.]